MFSSIMFSNFYYNIVRFLHIFVLVENFLQQYLSHNIGEIFTIINTAQGCIFCRRIPWKGLKVGEWATLALKSTIFSRGPDTTIIHSQQIFCPFSTSNFGKKYFFYNFSYSVGISETGPEIPQITFLNIVYTV